MNTVRTKLSVKDIMLTKADRRALDALQVRNLQQFRGWTAQMETDVVRAVTDGVAAGENIDKISGRISEAIDASKTRARRIARTESINAAVEGARNRYREYGIEKVEVIACDDWRTCKICQQHDGKIYSVDDDAHMPPYHPNCRCAIKAVVKKDKEKEPAKLRKKPEKRVPKVEPNITSVNADRQIPDFSQMKTMSEIEDGLRATFGKDIVIDEGFSTLNPESVAPGFARMEPVIQDYPIICQVLTDFNGREIDGYASTLPTLSGRLHLSLNKRKYECTGKERDIVYAEYLESTKDHILPDGSIDPHFHPRGTTFDDNPVHESGHVVEYALIINRYSDAGEICRAWNECEIAKEICVEAYQELQKEQIVGRRSTLYELRLDLSDYSTWYYSETMAEAFADYYANREGAKAISKKIIEITKRRYDEVYKK